MADSTVVEYLKEHDVDYELLTHPAAYTAQEAAASAGVSGKQYAKSVMVKVDDDIKMAVLAAADKVDLNALKDIFGAKKVRLAGEDEFQDLFPDCDLGAMPPFGNLYDVDVVLDQGLAGESAIAFCAGSHSELMRMAFSDYQRLAQPQMGDFALRT